MSRIKLSIVVMIMGLFGMIGSAIGQSQTVSNTDLVQLQQEKQGIVKPSFGLSPVSGLKEGEMKILGETVLVELALDSTSQAQGLMFREEMPEDRGMLFMFPEMRPLAFWMKNTLIPLDIIYIDNNGEVVHIVTAKPCKVKNCPSYPSASPAQYVLELNGGEAQRRGLKVGDNIRWEW